MLLPLLILIVLLLVLGVFATLPYRLLRFARANCRRMDNSFSRLRAKKELRQLVSFSAEVLMVPILALGLSGAALMAVHTWLIPLPLLEQVISLFEPSFAKWDDNMESGEFGDVGRTYGEFAESAGYSRETAYSMRKTLKHGWWVFAILFVAFAVFIYWFVTNYYLYVVDQYRKGIFERQTEYSRVDEKRMLRNK